MGPVAFLTAWVVGGLTTPGYSPVFDAVSRLAAVGSSARPLMTAGFVVFGLAVPVYALDLRAAISGAAWTTAAATGVATLGVAAFPLDVSPTVDSVHAGFAVAGYLTLAATPLLAAGALSRAHRRRGATASVVLGLVSGTFLVASLLGPAHGLLQRAGLTVGHGWVAATAAWLLHRRTGPSFGARGGQDGVEAA